MLMFPEVRPISQVALNILKKRYFKEGETTWNEVADRSVDWVLSDSPEESKELTRELIRNRYFIPNSPCLVNSGKTDGGLAACFVVDFPDTIEGIYKTKLDFALIARKGGGCGTTLSKIRPEGTRVSGSTHGYAGGPVNFFNTICHDMEVISQGGFRQMAMMGTISVYHPDILKFITAKETEGKMSTTNISVVVDDRFMKLVEEDKEYDTFFDYEYSHGKVREFGPSYKARDIFNLIVEGAWKNGEPGILFYDTMNDSPYKYSNQEILATNPCLHPDTLIETVNGRVKIKDIKEPTYVYTVGDNGKLEIRKTTNSWISKRNTKTLIIKINNGDSLTVTPEHKILSKKRGWISAQDLIVGEEVVALCRSRRGAGYSGIKLSTDGNRDYKMEHRFVYNYFNEIPDGYDIHHKDGNTYNNSIFNLELLDHKEHAKLTALTQPNNHQISGEYGRFISPITSRKGKKIVVEMPRELRSNFPQQPRVVSITEGEETDVYDISVEGTHNLIANYIVVHNCGEQPLPFNGVCNLGSLDISKFLDEEKSINWSMLSKAVTLSVRFLNEVVTKSNYPTEDIRTWVSQNLPIGLGIMGFADYLLIRGIAYGSSQSLQELEDILYFISVKANEESILLGKELGIPEACKELPTPRRNITVLSIAPTGTISLIAGCNSGIEPFFSEIVVRNDKTGTYEFNNNLAEQDYFRCAVSANGAKEVTWEEHVKVQASAQKYVDSGVSKTINFPNHTRRETIYNAFMLAWRLGCKGITVYRNGSRKVEVLQPKELKRDKCPVCGNDLLKFDGCKKCSNTECNFSLCDIN